MAGPTLAIAACATLLAGAPHAPLIADAHINSTAHAHSPPSGTRTIATTTMAAHAIMHTIARCNTALSPTWHLIPARAPEYPPDGTIDRATTILTMAA